MRGARAVIAVAGELRQLSPEVVRSSGGSANAGAGAVMGDCMSVCYCGDMAICAQLGVEWLLVTCVLGLVGHPVHADICGRCGTL